MTIKKPQLDSLTLEQVEEMLNLIDESIWPQRIKDLMTNRIRFNLWLADMLQNSRNTVSKLLYKLFAKFRTEKAHSRKKKPQSKTPSPDPLKGPAKPDPSLKKKGHEHRPASSFATAKIIEIALSNLKEGDFCPACFPVKKSKLYKFNPGIILVIHGEAPFQPLVVKLLALRCPTCSTVYKPPIPKVFSMHSRTTPEAKALAVFLKYKGGIPFYRLEMLQTALGAQITDSEVWEMMDAVAVDAMPAYLQLHKEAAKAETVLVDDTPMSVLSLMKENEVNKQAQEKLKKELVYEGKKDKLKGLRVGIFTTGIVSQGLPFNITMYFTGRQHAGENFDDLLDERPKDFPIVIQACDASSNNNPRRNPSIQGLCNSHNRRNFFELLDLWPKEVNHILGLYTSVFYNELQTLKMNPEERLNYHQIYSSSIMQSLKKYCDNLVETKIVEPNCSFGKAIAYQKKHWEGLTLFLRLSEVPLTTNAVERALKSSIRNRKNSLFYKTEWGALVGDVHHSIIETCTRNNINPLDYLTALQLCPSQVKKDPHLWLPWNFSSNPSYIKEKTERDEALDALLRTAVRPIKLEEASEQTCAAARTCNVEPKQASSVVSNNRPETISQGGLVKRFFQFKKIKDVLQTFTASNGPVHAKTP